MAKIAALFECEFAGKLTYTSKFLQISVIFKLRIFDGDTFIEIEPYKVRAIDTNGAGDMFAGAFLYGITHGNSYAEAGKIASLASSRVVSQFGQGWHRSRPRGY